MTPAHSQQSEGGEWLCEQHPEQPWPHGDCAGPGMLVYEPHEHVYDERGFCRVCRITVAGAPMKPGAWVYCDACRRPIANESGTHICAAATAVTGEQS